MPEAGFLAWPHDASGTNDYILTPLLTLPESFQSAYVGELFSCALSANNELKPEDDTRTVSGIRLAAEIVSPSNPSGLALDLEEHDSQRAPKAGESLQKILRLNLSEEGEHTLAVTVTYTETASEQGRAAGGRIRTFRKLYQFVASSLISVRTKAGELDGGGRFALEAQLENTGERSVALEVSKQHGPKIRLTMCEFRLCE